MITTNGYKLNIVFEMTFSVEFMLMKPFLLVVCYSCQEMYLIYCYLVFGLSLIKVLINDDEFG